MHEVREMTFSTRRSKASIQRECDEIAKRCGEYHKPLYTPITFYDDVMKNYEEAKQFICKHDKGFYDALAVRYKEERKKYWLVQFEYHV